MTLLKSVQSACRRLGIGVPASVVAATDDMTLQLLELANEAAEDICDRHGWSALRVERVFTTRAQVAQTGSLPADFRRMAPGQTMWNRSQNLRVAGPLSPEAWAQLQAFGASYSQSLMYRLIGGAVHLFPAPGTGQKIAFEYISNGRIVGADGLTFKTEFSEDDDRVRFPEHLLARDLRWRWKAAKGLNYAEELAMFERSYELAVAADRGEVEISTSSDFGDDFLSDSALNGNIAPTVIRVDGGLIP